MKNAFFESVKVGFVRKNELKVVSAVVVNN